MDPWEKGFIDRLEWERYCFDVKIIGHIKRQVILEQKVIPVKTIKTDKCHTEQNLVQFLTAFHAYFDYIYKT